LSGPPNGPHEGDEVAAAAAAFRAEFELSPDEVLLNSAGVSPMCRPALAAIERAAAQLRRGWFALPEVFGDYEGARAVYARLCGARPDDVAMFHTCAAALSQVALGLELRPGDELLIWDQEYPSNAYPWHAAARRSGAVVKVVPSLPGHRLDQERLHAAITPRTRAVAVSWVQYATGAMTELEPLARACHDVGAWLCVDAIQGLGVRPLDLQALGVDAVCGGAHKWLCGPLGHGFLALAPGRAAELEPILQGAMTYGGVEDVEHVDPARPPRPDARRFEPGSPLLLAGVGGAAATELCLRLGPQRLGEAALRIAQELADGVQARGAEVLSPLPLQVPIVTFVPRGGAAATPALGRALRARRIACAERAGGIRLAPHAFNTREDVARFLQALDAIEHDGAAHGR
jgi:selenocysteine lyase/cysteine desulfurase